MKHSVFKKIILGLMVIILLAEAVMLFLLYRFTYDHTVQDATNSIQYAASSVANGFEVFNPDITKDHYSNQKFLKELCSGLHITYLYVIEPDVNARNETYIVTGWGENASAEFKNNRYYGYVAKGTLKDEQIKAFQGEEHVMIHDTNQYDDTLICYTPIRSYYSPESKTVVNKIKYIVCAEVSLSSIMTNFNHRFNNFVLIMGSVTLLILIVTSLILYFRVSKPLRFISVRMKGFVSQKDNFFEKLPVKGKDEIAEMSDAFNTMAEEIDAYIMKLSELNRQKAELNIAKSIQRGLLEPQSFDNEAVSIRASMLTAKDVGGDLYDYCVLDNGDVFIAIADVSGKGITASLFMSRAVTLLHQYAKLGYSPEKMLYEYNNSLAEHNPNKMFITTFVAVYHPQTGALTYANAGHNTPYILSDTLMPFEGKHGAAAGVFKNIRYPEYTVPLKPNDRLFLFTDGVTEALNQQGEFFGDQRLEDVLDSHLGDGAESLVNTLLDEIKRFTNGADQADDITMLSLQVAPETEQA